MSANLSALAYLVAGICFIMALRSLSSPVTARRGNLLGMAGMIIAVGTTLLNPVVVGFELILAGLLIGAVGSGFMLAIMMATAGGAWDNAKKYVELGNYGGKGSDAHKAAVEGDVVGDPFKDTSGPSLNILLKLMAIVSLVFAPVFLKVTPLIDLI